MDFIGGRNISLNWSYQLYAFINIKIYQWYNYHWLLLMIETYHLNHNSDMPSIPDRSLSVIERDRSRSMIELSLTSIKELDAIYFSKPTIIIIIHLNYLWLKLISNKNLSTIVFYISHIFIYVMWNLLLVIIDRLQII